MTIDQFWIPGGEALPIGNPDVGGIKGDKGDKGDPGADGLNAADYGVFTVATTTVAVDRGWLFALYDHTIEDGETDCPPLGSVFRSTVDGKIYQRLADGSTDLLNNASGEYGGGLASTDIDTLAELNAILTDATLIDTTDPRLSDSRDPNSHTHSTGDLTGVATSSIVGRVTGGSGAAEQLTATQVRTLINVEDGATADQSDAEIATAYANEVAQVSGGEITAGTESALRTYSPADIVAIVGAHESGGGGMDYISEARTGSDPNYVYDVAIGSIDALRTNQSTTNVLTLSAEYFNPHTDLTCSLGQGSYEWLNATISAVYARTLRVTELPTSAGLAGVVYTDNGLPRISGTTGSAVEVISQGDAETGTATVAQQWTAERVSQAIAAQALQSADIGVSVQAYDADTAKTDVSQEWTAPQRSSVATLTVTSGEISDDADSGPLKQKVTLSVDITDATIINGNEGQARVWYIKQDGTGGRTVTFSGIDGTAPTIDTAADALTVVEFENVATTGWRFVG